MSRQLIDLGTLTIPLDGWDSDVISTKVGFGHLIDALIWSPATLDGTVTVLVGPDEDMDVGDMSPLNVATRNVTMVAGEAVLVPAASFRSLALQSDAALGASGESEERVFRIIGQVELT
jgi:hypothetical protein